MQFHTFVFDSDYLEAGLISLENCCLLSTRIPMKHPRVFFSRNPSFDCQCEVLVIEVQEDGLANFKRTQKEAKTVIAAIDAFSALDAFLGLGKKCATVLIDSGNAVVRIEGEDMNHRSDDVSELPSFAEECGVTDAVNPCENGSLLDSGLLRRTSWLTGALLSRKSERVPLTSPSCSFQCNSNVASSQSTKEDDVDSFGSCLHNPTCSGIQKDSLTKPLRNSVNNLKLVRNTKRISISSSAPACSGPGVSGVVHASRLSTSPIRSCSTKLRSGRRKTSTGYMRLMYLGETGYDVVSSDYVLQIPALCNGWINIANGDYIYTAKTGSRRSLYGNIKGMVGCTRRERKSHHSRLHNHFK